MDGEAAEAYFLCLPVQEHVLRRTEGSEQRASDGGYVFHGYDREDISLARGAPEKGKGQRDENDEGNVVGNEHRGKKYPENKEQRQSEHALQLFREVFHRPEYALALEALQNAEHHQQISERAPVDAAEKTGRRRGDDEPRRGGEQRNEEHGLTPDEFDGSGHFICRREAARAA